MGRTDAKCRAALQKLEAGLFRPLDATDRHELRQHLLVCEACRRRARLLTARLENLADFDLVELMELRLRCQGELAQSRRWPLMIFGSILIGLSWLSYGVFTESRPSEGQLQTERPVAEVAPVASAQSMAADSISVRRAQSSKAEFSSPAGPSLSPEASIEWAEDKRAGGSAAADSTEMSDDAGRAKALAALSGYRLGPAWSAGPVQFGFLVDVKPGSGLGVIDSVALARIAEREGALPQRIVIQSLAGEIVWPPAWMIEAPWGWRISREAFFGESTPRELAVQGVEDASLMVARAEAAEALRWRPVLGLPIAAPRAVRLALCDGADCAELRSRLLPEWNARGLSRFDFSVDRLPERLLSLRSEVLQRASQQRGLRGLVLLWNGRARSVDVFADAASAFAASAALLLALVFELADSEIQRLSGAGDWRDLDGLERSVLDDFFRRGLSQLGEEQSQSSDSAAELSCKGERFAFFRLARD